MQRGFTILSLWITCFFCAFGTTAKADTVDTWKTMFRTQYDDSARVRHILIAYQGAQRSTATRTKAQAKALADSIAQLVRKGQAWETLCKQYTDDKFSIQPNPKTNVIPYGDYGWLNNKKGLGAAFVKPYMVFALEHPTGDVDVVESVFGYHVMQKLEGSKTHSYSERPVTNNEPAHIKAGDQLTFKRVTDQPVPAAVETITVYSSNGKKIASFDNIHNLGDNAVTVDADKLVAWMKKKKLQEAEVSFESSQIVPSTQVQHARKPQTVLRLKLQI